MKKIITISLLLSLIAFNGYAGKWDKANPLDTDLWIDFPTDQTNNNDALDRLLAGYRKGLHLTYSLGTTIIAGVGEITVSNEAGTERIFLRNTSATNITFADLDTGSEGASKTYYVYAIAATNDAETATFKISENATAPDGVTYYQKIGSFYNNSSSDIDPDRISNDDVYHYTIASSGTVAHSGTVALITDYTAAQCDIIVSGNDIGPRGSSSEGYRHYVSINSSRVVTARSYNSVYGSYTSGTANYLIICNK